MLQIQEIAKTIEENGGRLYLVGGAIRDELLERVSFDEDYCITGLESKKFLELFPDAYPRGKSFEVYDLEGHEFAFARTEEKTGTGHKDFAVQANKEITIIEDLKRRDITINAIAKDVLTGEMIDPFFGKKDLENRKIRAVSDHFREDPLRVYRVARFASQLGFKVEENTIHLMKILKQELKTLSGERVFTEFKKALGTKKPSYFFQILKKAEVLEPHFAEIYNLIGQTQPEKYHPEGDSYNHTMNVLDKAADLTGKLEIRFGALVHDLGKGTTPKEMLPHHYGHEDRGVELVGKLGDRICIPTAWIKCGKCAAKEHMRGAIFYKMKPINQVRFLERVEKSYLGLEGLKVVVMADRCSDRECEEEKINFDVIGKKLMKEISSQYVAKKYKMQEGKELGEKIFEERVKWIKEYLTKSGFGLK